MKKKYLFMSAAAIMMASCASDDIVGDATVSSGETPIAFNMQMPASTRADQQQTGATAAKSLNYEFIVWGEKGETDKTVTSAANLVFENYRVQYSDNNGSTKNSTVSNTTGWDYVGIAPYASDKVYPAITATSQTIKYWDFGKTYTFTAVSAKPDDISNSKVKITKTEGSTSLDSKEKGYTIELKNGADASAIYVADRMDNVKYDNAQVNIAAVQMQFRQFQTKVRFGFYETVPGYNVQITGVKYNSATSAATKFGVDGKFLQVPTGTSDDDKLTYTVTYDANNKPIVSITAATTAQKNYEEFGSYMFTTDLNLGTTSSAPTYDKDASGSYTQILPNTGNETPMTFTVSYKLISEDTKEVIEIKDRQVTVPAVYCQWKPNFAYTYLFKVSDASAELYPITFDAVVESDEVSKQETITEVGEPSITTYATVSADNNTVVTGKDEYETGNVIYAIVNQDGGMINTNTVLYTVTSTAASTGGYAPEITEASVANCIANGTKNEQTTPTTFTVKDVTGATMVATKVTTDNNNFVTTVPNEDGNGTRTVNALKWTDSSTNAGTYYYAVEYSKTENQATKKYYKIVKVVKAGN